MNNNYIMTALIKKSVCDTGDATDHIGFSAEHGKHSVNFYADFSESDEIVVEDFGFMEKNVWKQLEPTPPQIDLMIKIITEHREGVFHNNRALPSPDDDLHRTVGHYDTFSLGY